MNDLEDIGGKKKALIILVGPPSGKSTWGKKFAKENNVEYISTSAIRAQIGSGEGDQSVSREAFGIATKQGFNYFGRRKKCDD